MLPVHSLCHRFGTISPNKQMRQNMQPWQRKLAESITCSDDLLTKLELAPQLSNYDQKAMGQFALRVPHGFVTRMKKGDPNDPLLLQVLPSAQELEHYPGYSHDPLAEKKVNPIAGLLHKYHSRILLMLSGGCAINCRYCFRRHFPYEDNVPDNKGWQKALDYIANDSSIKEVIFSGGDPLIVKDKQLAAIVSRIEKITHVTRLRIHTRLPIMIPERINDEFVNWIKATQLKPVVVLHCNHPNEINEAVTIAIKKLHAINITVLNQSVLLKNINDNARTLIELSHKLFDSGVMPYYLHLLDRVHGSAHFEVSEKTAKKLIQQVMNQLPGYLVPKLVREIAGAQAKVAI